MKKLIGLLFFTTAILCGCGSDGHKTSSPPSSSSLSSSSSSAKIVATSSSSSSISSSSSSANQMTSSISFTLTSNSFVADSNIPIKYSCYSTEISPHLKWEVTSDAVKSFALIMEDIDAIPIVGYPYVHWDVYNIPGTTREIAEGATLHAMPAGSIEGANDDNIPKYSGPCPPAGTGTHHYYFALYALNSDSLTFNANRSMKRSEFEKQYANNIIQKVEMIGLFKQ